MVIAALVSRLHANVVIGVALLVLGSVTITGWLLHVPAMVEIVHGLVPMVFNTGLGFALTGIGLLLKGPVGRVIRSTIGWFLICLCSLTLAEHVMDLSLGIDMALVHHWYDYGNTRPGRMAPNTAIGFMLIGAVYARLQRVKSRFAAYTVVVLTFCLLTIGLTGLVGYLLSPDLLFGWSRSARMAVHTATGMITAAIGIWTAWSKSAWFRDNRFFSEVAKVRLLGTAILIVVTTTVGLTGFVLMQKSLEKAIEVQLATALQSRTSLLLALSREIVAHAYTDMRLIDASAVALPLLTKQSGRHVAAFNDAAQRLLTEGYAHVAVEDSQRRTVEQSGAHGGAVQFQALLDKSGTELVWNNKLMLRVRQPLTESGELIGYLRLDRSLESFNLSLFNMDKVGKTGESAACVAQDQHLVCLPNSRNANVFVIDLRKRNKTHKLPMEYALAGNTGTIYGVDYRNQNVVAAYGPVFPGFGFVAKQDTIEAYAVIRQALEFGAPIVVLISIIGAFALYSQMDPVVSRMHRSERNAEQAAAETRSLMAAVGEGILTIDGQGIIRSINPAAGKIFGYHLDELAGAKMAVLIPPELRQAHHEGMANVAAGGAPRLIGTPNVKVDGLRKDGTRFPLELTISAVTVGTERWFVGVMRDITERLELERKLEHIAQYDSLTGLANRRLFMDRMRIALKRSERSTHSLAVVFIDLDGFKSINDTLGHQAGDQLLVEVAQRMSAVVRSTDTVARLGGDEFTVILEDIKGPAQQAVLVAHKLLAEIARPVVLNEGSVSVSVSVSVSASMGLVFHEAGTPCAETDVDALLRVADARMYAAKQAGKNCLVAS